MLCCHVIHLHRSPNSFHSIIQRVVHIASYIVPSKVIICAPTPKPFPLETLSTHFPCVPQTQDIKMARLKINNQTKTNSKAYTWNFIVLPSTWTLCCKLYHEQWYCSCELPLHCLGVDDNLLVWWSKIWLHCNCILIPKPMLQNMRQGIPWGFQHLIAQIKLVKSSVISKSPKNVLVQQTKMKTHTKHYIR